MVSAGTVPVVPSAGRHPETVPSSLTNRKRLSPKDVVLLNTCPVTLPSPGIETVNGALAVAWVTGFTLYSGDVPVSVEETQNGPAGAYETPHAFTRPGSVICAA